MRNSSNSCSFFELLVDAVKHCEALTIIPYMGEDITRNILIPLSFTNLRRLSLHSLKAMPPISLKGLSNNLVALSLIDCSVDAANTLTGFILMQHQLESLNVRLICKDANELLRTFLELLKNLTPTLQELVFEFAENKFRNEQVTLALPAIDEFFSHRSLTTLILDKRIFNSLIKTMNPEIFEAMPHLQSVSFGEAERNEPRWSALKAKCEERRRMMLGLCVYHRNPKVANKNLVSMIDQFMLGHAYQQD